MRGDLDTSSTIALAYFELKKVSVTVFSKNGVFGSLAPLFLSVPYTFVPPTRSWDGSPLRYNLTLRIRILILFFVSLFSGQRETRNEKTTDKSTKSSGYGIVGVHQITGDHADDAENCRTQNPNQFFIHVWKSSVGSVECSDGNRFG